MLTGINKKTRHPEGKAAACLYMVRLMLEMTCLCL